MPRLLVGIIVVAAVAFAFDHDRAIAGASHYRWTDADRVVHYSNLPPRSAVATSTTPREAADTAGPFATDLDARTVRIITATAEYRMGDRDTREDALRLAIGAAKANALEQVAAYVQRAIVVSNARVTKDEIQTYTAGLTRLLDQKIKTRLEGDTVVIRADVTVEVDGADVVRAIAALVESERAQAELTRMRAELDLAQRQLDAARRALAEAAAREHPPVVPATSAAPAAPPVVVWIPAPPPQVVYVQQPWVQEVSSPTIIYAAPLGPRFFPVGPTIVRPTPRAIGRTPQMASGQRPQHGGVARSR